MPSPKLTPKASGIHVERQPPLYTETAEVRLAGVDAVTKKYVAARNPTDRRSPQISGSSRMDSHWHSRQFSLVVESRRHQ